MKAIRHPSNNRMLGAPPGWDQEETPCNALPVTVIETNNTNIQISYWKPSAEEIAALRQGAFVTLWVHGDTHPVVAISVNK